MTDPTCIFIFSSKPRCIAVIITPRVIPLGIVTRTMETTTTIDTGTPSDTIAMMTPAGQQTGMTIHTGNRETILIHGKETMN